MTLKDENWYWCDVCHVVAYKYDCDCGGTSCNAHGCDKCRLQWAMVDEAVEKGLAPSEEEAKLKNIKNWGSVETPETKLLEEILSETRRC